MLAAIFHGIVLAFGLILPLGLQNVFVFNQGASQRNFRGVLPVVLTASICDTFLILFAVLGVSVVVFTIPILQKVFFVVGFLFLVYMGWVIWKSKPTKMNKKEKALSPKKQIIFAMSVSLLNPHAILDTIGVIGTNSLSYSGLNKMSFTVSTILVSWLWFFGLAIAGKKIGDIDAEGKMINRINKFSAILIWGIALYIAYLLSK